MSDSESGQEQGTDTIGETMVEGERETRTEHPDAAGSGTHGSVEPIATRETAPMSEFTGRDAGIGFVVLLVGLLITVVIPLVFTLG